MENRAPGKTRETQGGDAARVANTNTWGRTVKEWRRPKKNINSSRKTPVRKRRRLGRGLPARHSPARLLRRCLLPQWPPSCGQVRLPHEYWLVAGCEPGSPHAPTPRIRGGRPRGICGCAPVWAQARLATLLIRRKLYGDLLGRANLGIIARFRYPMRRRALDLETCVYRNIGFAHC